MAIDIIARGMIEDSNGNISQLSEKVSNHTDDSDIHVTVSDKENWNSHPNDVMASGNPVQIDGMQGGVPFSEMVVKGKNLLKYPYYTTTKTINGVTFTDNGDGTITANGTATAEISFALVWKNIHIPKGTYAISGCPEGGDLSTGFYIVCGTDIIRFSTDVGNGGTFTISEDTNDFTFSIRINSGVTVDNLIFRPQLELGSTPTEYEPPITGRELTVGVSGKNLIPYPYAETTKTVNGITFTDNGDGTITANGTATASAIFYISTNYTIKKGIYTLSGCPKSDSNTDYILQFATGDWSFKISDFGNGATTQIDNDINLQIFRIAISNGVTVDNLVFRPQLELGDTATEYEPYNGTEYNITPDNNPYIIPNDIRQQYGYNVVSVSEGELSVVGVRKNAALKKIWDDMSMDLLFDGVTSADNPAVVDLANYKFVEIHHIMMVNEKAYPVNIRLSLDSYLSSASTISTPISNSTINTIHTEEGTVSSLYAISAAGSNMNNTKIYGIK